MSWEAEAEVERLREALRDLDAMLALRGAEALPDASARINEALRVDVRAAAKEAT